jgi:hypothetical protein
MESLQPEELWSERAGGDFTSFKKKKNISLPFPIHE